MIDTIYAPDSFRSKGLVTLTGFLAAVALFIAIPLIQAISTGLKDPNKLSEIDFVLPPPPVVDVEPPPPPKKEDKQDEMEMDKEPPRLSLDQLDLALNPSMGDMSGFSIDLSLDADSLGTSDLIFDIGDVEEKPVPTRQIEPTYPPALRRQKIDGSVVLVFVVDEQGNVVAPRVERSTHMEFEKPALDAIRRWKFTPGKKDGKEVKVRVRAPLIFKVN
jgi:periplasmic protein TonB